MTDAIVIVSAARTPMGSFQSDFASLAAHDLGGAAIRAAVERAGIQPEQVEEVIFGNCLMAGQGQAPARQAGFKGGLPKSAGAVTLSKMCGSGMRAAMFAHDMLLAGSAEVVVAGGMESMTNAPYLLQKARGGYRIGHDRIFDHMMLDGLEDAYEPGRSMGTFGEDCAAKYSFTRAEQDAFATASVQRAKAATETGAFAAEITPVTVKGRGGETVISIDEGPGKVKLDKIPTLKPAFKKDGTITAASSSSINDGAAAMVLMRASTAARLGMQAAGAHREPRGSRAGARVVCHRAGRCHAESAGQGRLERGRRGPVGSQRGLRRGAHGADEGTEPLAQDRQRQRRRLRAGPPDRREWRAHHGHIDPRPEGAWPQERPGHAVHRRRRGDRRGAGVTLVLIADCGRSTLA